MRGTNRAVVLLSFSLLTLNACGGRAGTSANDGGAGSAGASDGSAGTTGADAKGHDAATDASTTITDAPTDAPTSSDADSGVCRAPQPACSALPPSCAPGGPGMSDCGANRDNCCASLPVTGGTFSRTFNRNLDGFPPDGGLTGEADPATVSSFRLDKYDVTVGRFRRFAAAWAAGWKPAPGAGKHAHLNGGLGLRDVSAAAADAGTTHETGWLASYDGNVEPTNSKLVCGALFSSWTPSVGDRENHPINCVTWFEAQAFCIWDGGFLPSEAEYEYAAAGGSEQRGYPWGSADPEGAPTELAIHGDDRGNCYYPSKSLNPCTAMSIAPVGTASSGAGRYGQLDLSGNVWQWVSDWYFPYGACTDCAASTEPAFEFRVALESVRVLRGGSFSSQPAIMRAPSRGSMSGPALRSAGEGFRCARTP